MSIQAKHVFLQILFGITLFSCQSDSKMNAPHIAFVVGDEEYRSEESMPMLAQILKRELGARISLCYALDSSGYIDPNRSDYINNLESLDSADLMVLFTRFRKLPREKLQYIIDYVESGKPVVGFRTSTHAFLYEDSSLIHMNDEWPSKLFGQQWITHHGHFEDGNQPLTAVSKRKTSLEHPILNGVSAFDAFSWLYHVDGGEWQLHGNCNILLDGKSLRSNHQTENRLDKFPISNPVAWTKTYIGSSEKEARVFFTTLGHPYDFKHPSMRKLALNGIYWALEKEDQIPEDGVDCSFASDYSPNNSGFGNKFKAKQKPLNIQ